MKHFIKKPWLLIGSALLLSACGGDDVSSSADGSSSGSDSETSDSSFSVDAGYGRVVVAGDTVSLAASVGYEADQTGTLLWTQLSGPSVSLSDSSAEDPSFTAPEVSERTRLIFQLAATSDSETLSDTVAVEIWVAADSSTDKTLLGDFSDEEAWGCHTDPSSTPEVSVTDNGSTVRYSSNGIPAHATGTFPNFANPNTISEQVHEFDIPTTPEKLTYTTNMGQTGITLDGVPMERDTAESYQNANVWHYEAITPGIAAGTYEWTWLGTDCNNAHVQPTGNYHYHGLMEAFLNQKADEDGAFSDMVLVGYAADGFPMYARYGYADASDSGSGLVVMEGSYELKSGTRSGGPGGSYDGTFIEDWEYVESSGDLDECNGRYGVTPEYPEGIYHYYITDDYPYIARCVHGEPDSSFRVMMGG